MQDTLAARIKGRVEKLADGRFYWWCELHIGDLDECISINSKLGEKPLIYNTREEATIGLKECGKRMYDEMINKTGPVIAKQNNGKSITI